jgi:hypothetical protein
MLVAGDLNLTSEVGLEADVLRDAESVTWNVADLTGWKNNSLHHVERNQHINGKHACHVEKDQAACIRCLHRAAVGSIRSLRSPTRTIRYRAATLPYLAPSFLDLPHGCLGDISPTCLPPCIAIVFMHGNGNARARRIGVPGPNGRRARITIIACCHSTCLRARMA